MTTENTETSNPDALATLVRAAAAFAYRIARGIKEEDGEKARALAMALADDPAAEFIASVRLAPDKCVVLSVVVGGKQFIVHHEVVLDDAGIRH